VEDDQRLVAAVGDGIEHSRGPLFQPSALLPEEVVAPGGPGGGGEARIPQARIGGGIREIGFKGCADPRIGEQAGALGLERSGIEQAERTRLGRRIENPAARLAKAQVGEFDLARVGQAAAVGGVDARRGARGEDEPVKAASGADGEAQETVGAVRSAFQEKRALEAALPPRTAKGAEESREGRIRPLAAGEAAPGEVPLVVVADVGDRLDHARRAAATTVGFSG
jgi:hypothetical protein